MANSQLNVVIIVPTYNESGNIERLVEILEKEIFPKIKANYQMEILVVDDNSPDGTGSIVKNIIKKSANIYLLSNPKKIGLGGAYTKGMQYALETLKADIVFEFDADLSHDPQKIPIMLNEVEHNYDLVLGSRYIKGGSIPANWGWHRKFMSVVGNLVARILITDFAIHDWTGGFRAIKAEVIRSVLPLLNSREMMGYTFQIGFLFNARRLGYRVKEVPFHFMDRTLGKSKMPTSYIKNTLLYIIRVRKNEIVNNRIFKFAVVGLVGGLIQLTSLQIFRNFMPFQMATFFSVELAILSNFIWSNLWTFGDRKLRRGQVPLKYIQFNLTSAGSLLIQQVVAYLGENKIGLYYLFTTPILGIEVDTGLVFAVTGILLGMCWNFFAYSKIVWKRTITA